MGRNFTYSGVIGLCYSNYLEIKGLYVALQSFTPLLRLISVNVAKYILSFPSNGPGGTKFEIFCDHTAYLHFIF